MQIQPITFLGKTYTNIEIIVESFAADSLTGKLFIMLTGDNARYEENLNVPAEVWANYGTDDQYIVDWVLATKGLEIYQEPVETAEETPAQ